MNEDDNESDENSPPRKLRKMHYDQKYSKSWEKIPQYSGWIKSSTKGIYYFYCMACKSDLKCEGGKFTVSKHAESLKHISCIKDTIRQPTIASKLVNSSKSSEVQVKAAEIKMACFLAKNNLSFNVADDLKNLIQSACPDSDIAKKLKFGRTKAHAIITNVTGKAASEELLHRLRHGKFSLIADESTDRSTIKHMALVVRTAVNYKIEDNFLCLLPVSDCTAVSLHRTCKEFFEKEGIPYKENMIGFACDGANNMSGERLSLAALFAKDTPNLFIMKCICHSFHLCASYACKELPRGVEDFARDVYSYLKNSPKRLDDYKDFQKYLKIKPHKLLHPSQTRWLSLLPVVERLIEQLPALKLYFTNAVLADRLLAAESILEKCVAPSTILYLQFLKFVLPYFHDLNKEMQSERPKLFILYERVFSTYKTLLECFVKSECLELSDEEKQNSSNHTVSLENKILKIQFEQKDNHLSCDEIYLGGDVMALLATEDFVHTIGEIEIKNFISKCLLFYITSIKQIRNRFPFDDLQRQRLKNSSFLNPKSLIEKKSVTLIANLKTLFPDLCPSNITELDREWRLLRNTSLPYDDAESSPKVEDFWNHVSAIKKGDQSQVFPLLSKFVQQLLVLPHSSANVERVFSAVNLLKTSSRNNLSTDTLQGLLHTKRFIKESSEQLVPTDVHFKLFNQNMYCFKE